MHEHDGAAAGRPVDEREATTKQTMDFGPDGLPNGYVRENSAMCVQSCWERYTVEEIKDILESTCLEAASKGIVQVHTDDFNLIADDDFEDVLQAYRELNEEGRLPSVSTSRSASAARTSCSGSWIWAIGPTTPWVTSSSAR